MNPMHLVRPLKSKRSGLVCRRRPELDQALMEESPTCTEFEMLVRGSSSVPMEKRLFVRNDHMECLGEEDDQFPHPPPNRTAGAVQANHPTPEKHLVQSRRAAAPCPDNPKTSESATNPTGASRGTFRNSIFGTLRRT